MNRRQAFEKGLAPIRRSARMMAKSKGKICAFPPGPYNARRMLNQIHQGDCIEMLNGWPKGWADLVFADPPFNIGYMYQGYKDERGYRDYLRFSTKWMKAVHRALRPNGSFYLAIGDAYAAELSVIARRNIGFHLRNWIVWHYTFGQQTKRMYAKSHTHILYFTKSSVDFTFNADAVRVASARQTTYNDARANPKGKLPDDVWYLRPQEAQAAPPVGDAPRLFAAETDTWNISRVCGTFKEREGWHGCQMPMAVLERIILSSSNPGDVVLDPFNGSGTTVVAAAMLDRKYVGIEQGPEYVAHAQKRLEHALELKLAAKQKNGGELFAKDRASRILTETDAFGRKRVPRTRRRSREAENQVAEAG